MRKNQIIIHISLYSLYRYIFMPFRIGNSSETFRRPINVTLFSVKSQFASIFIRYTRTEQHVGSVRLHICNVPLLLHSTAATFKLKQFRFSINKYNYLSHFICLKLLIIAPFTTDAIRESKIPSSFTIP